MDVSIYREGRHMLNDRFGEDFDHELEAECEDEWMEFL